MTLRLQHYLMRWPMLLPLAFACLLFVPSAYSQKGDTIPRLPELYKQRVSQFNQQPVTKGNIIFLGNSITQGGNWASLLKDSTVLNRGIGGDITFGVLKRLDEVIQRQPSKLFILIGINDLANKIPVEVIIENLFTIARRVQSGSPSTAVFIQSILPVNPSFENFPKGYDVMEQIVTINQQLQRYSSKLNYTYVDLFSSFTDSNALLDQKYATDGLHLNQAGYQNWVATLKKLKHL